MRVEESCCTCAALLSSIPPAYDEKTEKPARFERHLGCCGRVICARCITDNPRFESYCPYCQVTTGPSSLPQGLRDPPAYSATPAEKRSYEDDDDPPPYKPDSGVKLLDEKAALASSEPAEDVLHFIDPEQDTIKSLSLRYGVPADMLRRKNNLFSDHLITARRTILIPGEFYQGVSLSPRPVEGEEEELRKSKVRKWMVACKIPDVSLAYSYDVALLYLDQADYDLELAIESFREDERWEKENPLQAAKRGKAKSIASRPRWRSGGGLTGQL